MSARRARTATVVRSIGIGVERGIAPAPRVAERYVALDRLRDQLDGIVWAPLRLGGERRARPVSPRLPYALVLHLACAARTTSDHDAPLDAVAVPLDVDGLGSFLGADPDAVGGVVGALRHAGVVHAVGATTADAVPAAVALAPALLGPAPRCAALAWEQVALATAGSPSAWVAAHVLAERLAPDEWTPMPRSALERTLGCGVSGVRSALERLTTARVIERREQRGGVSAYRFAPGVFAPGGIAPGVGRQGGGEPSRIGAVPTRPTPTPLTRPHPAPSAVSAAAAPAPPPAAAADTGVRLTVGGVEFDVPPGLRVRVELGPDGRPQISLVPVATAG